MVSPVIMGVICGGNEPRARIYLSTTIWNYDDRIDFTTLLNSTLFWYWKL